MLNVIVSEQQVEKIQLIRRELHHLMKGRARNAFFPTNSPELINGPKLTVQFPILLGIQR